MLEILSTYTNSTRMTLLLKIGGRQGGNYVWDYQNGLKSVMQCLPLQCHYKSYERDCVWKKLHEVSV